MSDFIEIANDELGGNNQKLRFMKNYFCFWGKIIRH